MSKDDLDIALKTAQKKRVERLDSELKKAVAQLDSSAALAREKAESGNEKESKKWKTAAEKAEAKAASARKEMDKITTVSTSPRVEVGCIGLLNGTFMVFLSTFLVCRVGVSTFSCLARILGQPNDLNCAASVG